MKTKDEILTMLFATLAELQSGSVKEDSGLWEYLTTKLEVYYDILGEDVPQEYWEQIEEFI